MMNRILLFLLLTVSVFAEDLYFTQAGSGAHDGTVGNPWSTAEASTAGNWGVGAGKVSAGDTLHVATGATITGTLTIQGSGSSGNVITILFDSGAKFSKAAWGVTTSSAIYASGKNFIKIDGGTNGIIECTDNGDALGSQVVAAGIYATNCNDLEITSLTIQNIYVHVYNTNNIANVAQINGILAENGNNLSIHNCVINHAYYGIFARANGDDNTNWDIYSNTISACSTAINGPTLSGAGDSIAGVDVYNNDITMGLNWYDTPNNNHIDGIHAFGVSGTTDAITGFRFFNNYLHGDPSTHSTSPIFLEYTITNPEVFNNLVVGNTNHPSQGYCYIKMVTGNNATSTARVMNNTFVGLGSGSTGGIGLCSEGISGNVLFIQNNIFLNCFVGIYEPGNTATLQSDYNDFFGNGYVGWRASSSTTLALWRTATGGDANSINTDPDLDGSYNIDNTSPAYNTGTSLSAYFTTDRYGVTRPQSTTWDIGAMEVVVGSTTPVVTSAVVDTTGTTLTLNFNVSCTTAPGSSSNGVSVSPSGGASIATYASGTGSAAYVYNLSRTISQGETLTASYVRPTFGIDASTGGAPLASFSGQAVTNNSTVDAATPTLSSTTVNSAGAIVTFVFSEAMVIGAGGSGGWTPSLSYGAVTLTYVSGASTNTFIYSTSRAIYQGETGTIAYTQPGNGLEDGSGNDLATLSGGTITNNSARTELTPRAAVGGKATVGGRASF